MYKAPEIFSNTDSPTNVRAKPPDSTNGNFFIHAWFM